MIDEGKLHQQRDRGTRAEAVLENELVKEAFENIEKQIDQAWKRSPADADRERNNAYLMYRLLQNFRSQFEASIRTGKTAHKELMRIHDKSKLRRVISGR